MICSNCKNQIADGSKFCEFCGSKVGVATQQPNTMPPVQNYNVTMQNYRYPISVLGWIGRPLISCIPIVGPLIYFIMLFIWASDRSKEETFNNWAKAQLISLLIITLPIILIFLVIASSM